MVKIIKILKVVSSSAPSTDANVFSEASLTALSNEFKYNKCGVKKITAAAFIHGFMDMFQEGKNCLRTLCLRIGIHANNTLCQSSLEDRFNRRTFAFVVAFLEQVMSVKAKELCENTDRDSMEKSLMQKFNNVYLSDSTCQVVPSNLAPIFPSSHSKTGKINASLRLQVIFNYTLNIFSYFDMGSFRDNDQGASDTILEVAQAGDLVIRDLGYFSLPVFAKMVHKGIFLITKHKYGVTILDTEKEEPIDLLAIFAGKTEVDMMVKVGQAQQLNMRLVAKKLPKIIAIQRIAKAKKDRSSTAKHSKEYYDLLKWEIYLTNVEPQTLDIEQISELYKSRWFIEIIFKTWKSYFNFKKILNIKGMTYYRAIITIVLMLVKITYAFTHIFNYIDSKIQQEYQRFLSPLKFMDVINSLWHLIIKANTLCEIDYLIPQFAMHATYEKSKKRISMREKYI
jgi:IS4 transposase